LVRCGGAPEFGSTPPLDDAMRFYDNLPLNMYGWADEDIGIFGGWRADGFHKTGHMRYGRRDQPSTEAIKA
jgi:hypothetical protein